MAKKYLNFPADEINSRLALVKDLERNKAGKDDLDNVLNKLNKINISEGAGEKSVVQGDTNQATAYKSAAFGNHNQATGTNSFVEGGNTRKYDPNRTDSGNIASGYSSHAEGGNNKASGAFSHAEGNVNLAEGNFSHAEGDQNEVKGISSHAEGHGNKANGDRSHAEGYNTKANGGVSHAEGSYTEANGDRSHAEGYNTKTLNNCEHAEGKWNKSNPNTIHSIGIGTSNDNRKNAIEVKANGDIYIIGIGGYDGTNPETAKSIQQIWGQMLYATDDDIDSMFEEPQEPAVYVILNTTDPDFPEVELNTHIAVSACDIMSFVVEFENILPKKATYSLCELILVTDPDTGTYSWEEGEIFSSGNITLHGKGYVEFEEQIKLEEGRRYQLKINYYHGDDISTTSFDINGSYVEPMITTTSLMLGDEGETVINEHSMVSVDVADAIKVQVENEPRAIGFTYNINTMDYHEDEEGSWWTVGQELTAGEGNFNGGLGYSQFIIEEINEDDDTIRISDSHIIQFLEGNRYQVTVTVLGGNPSEPEQIGYYVYEINGSYNSREVETSLMSNDEETLLSEHSDTSVEQSDGISVRAIDYLEAAQFSFEINPMILHQDEQGISWTVDESVVIASGNSTIRGVGYCPFDNIISFNFGKRYRVKVTLYTFQLDELETIEYFINGATDTDVE